MDRKERFSLQTGLKKPGKILKPGTKWSTVYWYVFFSLKVLFWAKLMWGASFEILCELYARVQEFIGQIDEKIRDGTN